MSGQTFVGALRALSSSQKSSAGVSLYSRFVNRPLGRVFAAAAVSIGVSPNGVTALSALATAAGLVVLVVAPVAWWTGLVVSALLVLGFALDSADGQVARVTGRGSPAGEWLDHVVDAGKMVAVHAAVLTATYLNGLLTGVWLLLPLTYLFVSVVFFAALTLFELLQRARPGHTKNTRAPSTIRAVGLLPADYGILAMIFLTWGVPVVFLFAYGALLAATTIIAIALALKWFRLLSSP